MEKYPLINRDISWLSFNARVLQEAADPQVPLIERVKFLGIYSNNLDEFFRVRVAIIKRLLKVGKAKKILGEDADKLLARMQKTIVAQQDIFEETYSQILKELELHGIFILNEKQLSSEQAQFVRSYFKKNVQPTLVPIMVENAPSFPYLRDRAIYLFIGMEKKKKDTKGQYALVEIPTDVLSRFLVLPKDNKYIMLLDDVIRFCLDEIFSQFEYDYIRAYTIKLTRDAELDIEQDVTKSLVKKISESIKRRKKAQPVRLVYDETMPEEMLSFLIKKLKFSKQDNPIPGGRYHNFVDFINFPNIGRSELKYKFPSPLNHLRLSSHESMFKAIKEKDVLLHFPYQSYHHIIDLLREAAIDPKVRSIHITLYRAAKKSNIINALINAVKNGKQVTAVVELQARFDEEANIHWANKLQEEGVRIVYGVQGLKVHSKLFLITRIEENKMIRYAHIGTGNFNEDTARVYTDLSLLTCDKRITTEVEKIFGFYNNNYKTGSYKHIVVSPFTMRKRFLHYINKEIEFAKAGKPCGIILKMNSLVDEDLIKKLYEASKAGVKIKLIVRSICSIVPGLKGVSENIEAISIVDKYLEHHRVFIFTHGGNEKYFISSADWMMRNLDMRSEVAVPIYDKDLQQEIKKVIDIMWNDNIKARLLNKSQDNQFRSSYNKQRVRAQEDVYKFLRSSNRTEK